MDPEQVREFALALPHVEQYEHGGCPSFRVHGKRFASMLDADGVNIALDEHHMHIALNEWPHWCRPELFGHRLVAVRVLLKHADPLVVKDMLTQAWRRRAPKTLSRTIDDSG
jgi:hypothetical protein